LRHPRQREHTRGRRRQRIPQRVVQLGRRAMRWHVVVLTVCAASFSFLCCVVCWQCARNVFGLGVVPPCWFSCCSHSVKFVFLSRLLCLFASDRDAMNVLFLQAGASSHHMLRAMHTFEGRSHYALKTRGRSKKWDFHLSCAVAQENREFLKSSQEKRL
jgi:hypothetical protein